jgi:predicted  nucleic acid-binding Zn-ribbon protein
VGADPLDHLYELPLAEFTPARDALAKELKAAGEKEAAAAVKALRKPSAAAWAVNAAAREEPGALQALLDAGEALHRAQERLLAGKADRSELKAATDAERAAVSGMVAAALAAAREAGQPLSPSIESRVRETLHAATLDETVRAALAAGRLERETEVAGFAGALAALPARAPAPRPARAPKKEAERLKQRREAARAALSDANRTVREAEREADLAGRRLERAESGLAEARERLSTAERFEDEARQACQEAQRDLREAKAAAAAAQSAVDEAEA